MTSEAYVLPFDHLRMQDVGPCGRQERLPRRDDQPAVPPRACACPAGFATTAAAFRDFLGANELAAKIDGLLKNLDVDDVKALAQAGATIRRWMVDAPFPAHLDAEVRKAYDRPVQWRGVRSVVRGTLVGDGRGSARRVLCRAAGNVSQHPRHRQPAGSDQARIRLAVQRPRDLLPRPQGFQPRRRGAVRRHSAHGAQRPWRRAASCSRWTPSPVSTRWCSSPRATAWARRWCRVR